jgi:hypothetical protein
VEVPAVLVGALASAPRTRMSRGFHLITQHGPCCASTLAAFAGLRLAILHGVIDAIGQRRITHATYTVYSLALRVVSLKLTLLPSFSRPPRINKSGNSKRN